MPLKDLPPDALANVYARSLFELAEAAGSQHAVESCVAELEEVLDIARGDQRFSEFLASPAVPMTGREAALKRIFKGKISDLTLRFLLTLNRKRRLDHLPAIVAALDAMAQERFGRVEVDVFTAEPIAADDLRAIRERLTQALSREAIVHPYTEPAMIGGIKLRVGDRLIDGSLATQLRRIRDQLAATGNELGRSSDRSRARQLGWAQPGMRRRRTAARLSAPARGPSPPDRELPHRGVSGVELVARLTNHPC
jgi:F-type H+-transporting ATPase subunit delta